MSPSYASEEAFGTKPLPSWATLVACRTERNSLGIIYEVFIEDEEADLGDMASPGHGFRMLVWSTEIHFAQTDAHCSGGVAFREAAREQDAVAERLAARIRQGR